MRRQFRSTNGKSLSGSKRGGVQESVSKRQRRGAAGASKKAEGEALFDDDAQDEGKLAETERRLLGAIGEELDLGGNVPRKEKKPRLEELGASKPKLFPEEEEEVAIPAGPEEGLWGEDRENKGKGGEASKKDLKKKKKGGKTLVKI